MASRQDAHSDCVAARSEPNDDISAGTGCVGAVVTQSRTTWSAESLPLASSSSAIHQDVEDTDLSPYLVAWRLVYRAEEQHPPYHPLRVSQIWMHVAYGSIVSAGYHFLGLISFSEDEDKYTFSCEHLRLNGESIHKGMRLNRIETFDMRFRRR